MSIIESPCSPTRRPRRLSAGLGLLAVATAAVVPFAAPVAAAADAPSGLTITVSDAVEKVSPGDELTVEATLSNDGGENVDATLVLSAPAYTTYTSSDDATVSGGDAAWSVSVAAGESRTVTATVEVGKIPESEYQLSTLASVYLGEASGAPVIRAADVNVIPGRSNPVTPAASSDSASGSAVDGRLIIGAAAGAAGIAAAVAVTILARRRRQASQET